MSCNAPPAKWAGNSGDVVRPGGTLSVTWIAMADLNDISTPALVLDLPRLRANAAFMQERAAKLGLKLRPHMKTAKSADVARMATGEQDGITVSTLTEAEYFFANGFKDITLAVGFLPGRLSRALALTQSGAKLTLLTDNVEAATHIARASLNALIEIDCGDNRGGVPAGSDDLLKIASALGRHCAGVLTHGGHSYRAADVMAIQAVAKQERDAVVQAAARIRDAGLPCETVSVGSTPSCTHALDYDGCTEMRPGVYMFGDLQQAALGSLPEERIAMTVLCSVIGVYPAQNRLIVDAGGLALSKDVDEKIGYGRVLDVEGSPLNARVFACSQEHGQITADAPLPLERLQVGTRLRIMPVHACMTAAAHPGYHVVEGGTRVAAEWPRVNGWA